MTVRELVNRISLLDMVKQLGDRLTVGHQTNSQFPRSLNHFRFPSQAGRSGNKPRTNEHIGKHSKRFPAPSAAREGSGKRSYGLR
jgi:hypothetical protein